MSVYKADFPALHATKDGLPYTYLDNGATTQKPQCVIDALTHFYSHDYATIHRGVYAASQASTDGFDRTRDTLKAFMNARSADEIIFTKGTTESINLVARSYVGSLVAPGKTLLVTGMEHHANFVPWQQIAIEKGLQFKVVPLTATGELDEDAFTALLTPDVALVALTHISNALGTINDIKKWIDRAHSVGAKVLIDGAQSIGHMPVDVQALGCDFFVFSSHKCYGPTGVGVLYGKADLLEAMPPYQFGGDMVVSVHESKTTFAPLPSKFEAGTPAFSEIMAFRQALDYIKNIGFETIHTIESALLADATEALSKLPGCRIIGTAAHKAAIISFEIDGIHPHDIGTILDSHHVAIRVGHHCAQPVMQHFGVPATARASFSFYNTTDDIKRLVDGLRHAQQMFGV